MGVPICGFAAAALGGIAIPAIPFRRCIPPVFLGYSEGPFRLFIYPGIPLPRGIAPD
jgi:hypothetical protein